MLEEIHLKRRLHLVLTTRPSPSSEEKMAIVLEGLRGQKSVAEICREHQISQTLYYRWRDRFLEAGQKGLSNGGGEDEKALQAQIEKLEKIIGRQTIAIEALKKTQELISGKKTKLMMEKGMSLKSACEALGISRSGQYRKESQRQGSDKDEVLVEKLKELWLERPFWGYRRMTAWLNHREDLLVNRKRIYRLMRENGLAVEQVRHKALRSAQRGKPKATRPNQYWGIDMTKFLLGSSGWCYLMVVLDRYTKEIVGWKVSLRARISEWKEALDRALCRKFPCGVRGQGLNLISDNGSQPTSVAFMTETAGLGINQIFCSYDNPPANAETERVIRTIKEELLRLNEFGSFEEAEARIGASIGKDYNRFYVHSALGYLSPEEFAQQWVQSHEAASEGAQI